MGEDIYTVCSIKFNPNTRRNDVEFEGGFTSDTAEGCTLNPGEQVGVPIQIDVRTVLFKFAAEACQSCPVFDECGRGLIGSYPETV